MVDFQPLTGLPTGCVLRLRQWAQDRAALKTSRTTNYKREVWRERRTCEIDARLVRVLREAFACFSQEEQTALAATYRDRKGQSAAAFAVGKPGMSDGTAGARTRPLP